MWNSLSNQEPLERKTLVEEMHLDHVNPSCSGRGSLLGRSIASLGVAQVSCQAEQRPLRLPSLPVLCVAWNKKTEKNEASNRSRPAVPGLGLSGPSARPLRVRLARPPTEAAPGPHPGTRTAPRGSRPRSPGVDGPVPVGGRWPPPEP